LIYKEGKVFIIAELSANHNKNFDLAVRTIKAMKESGADAVKFQTYTPDSLSIDCDNEYFKPKTEGLWKGYTPYQLYQEAYTPWEWQPKLKQIAEDIGLICFSSPFDKKAVDFLEKMKVPAYKIASFEITDIPLIEYTASKNKPMILSTGIATLADIEEAIQACKRIGNHEIALLKCTSSYPAPHHEINLRSIPNLAARFKTIVGLSDHSLGYSVPIAAVALGAKIIEKHFILDRSFVGPDSVFSMEPQEFKAMVKSIREVEKALGTVNYKLSERALKNRKNRRSLFVVKKIRKGEIITENNVKSIRPGYGLHSRNYSDVLGKFAKYDIEKGTPFSWDLIRAC